jgi:myo-inositol-1(or 4)-monophosphatase
MRDPEMHSRIEAAKAAVLAQTGLLHREFGNVRSEWKHDGSRVTAADLAISEGIIRELSARFPTDDYLSEENGDPERAVEVKARFAWVLDPIDGTNNFATGIPYCAISLALLEQGEPVYGVVYDLARRVLLHGGPGFGAWEGDRAIHIKSGPPGPHALIGFHSPSEKKWAGQAAALISAFKIRGLGSSTLHLAYVAAGLLEGTVDHNVKVWDIAAAVPLCRAAGGEVRFLGSPVFPLKTFDLKMPRIRYCAGSPELVDILAGLLKSP